MLDVDDTPQYRVQCDALGLTQRDRDNIRRVVYFYLTDQPLGQVVDGGTIPFGGFPGVPMDRLNVIYVRTGDDVRLIAIEAAP